MELVDWKPYKHDEAWEIISSLYFCDGGKEETEAISASGEPWLPLSEFIIKENPNVKHHSIEDVWYWTGRRESYRRAYAKVWNDTATDKNGTVNVILCPVGPGAAPLLGHARYWSYTSQWNLLDYPALVFPVSRVDPKIDVADKDYKPANDKDEYNYKLCTCTMTSCPIEPRSMLTDYFLDDPEKYAGAPISLQLVGRRYEDEKVHYYFGSV